MLPPATQTGQRTFGCLVNGKAWNLNGNPLNGPLFTTTYRNALLHLSATGALDSLTSSGLRVGGSIGITVDKITAPGKYLLATRDSSYAGYNNVTTSCTYYTDAMHPATVIITKLDLVNRIVSGTFAFTLETPACGKVTVTDGRFDSLF